MIRFNNRLWIDWHSPRFLWGISTKPLWLLARYHIFLWYFPALTIQVYLDSLLQIYCDDLERIRKWRAVNVSQYAAFNHCQFLISKLKFRLVHRQSWWRAILYFCPWPVLFIFVEQTRVKGFLSTVVFFRTRSVDHLIKCSLLSSYGLQWVVILTQALLTYFSWNGREIIDLHVVMYVQ